MHAENNRATASLFPVNFFNSGDGDHHTGFVSKAAHRLPYGSPIMIANRRLNIVNQGPRDMHCFLHPGLAASSLIFGANEFVPRSGIVALLGDQGPRLVRVFENSFVRQSIPDFAFHIAVFAGSSDCISPPGPLPGGDGAALCGSKLSVA